MKLPSPYICDECPNQKKESNHWWVLLGFLKDAPEIAAFVLLPWASVTDPDGVMVSAHLCSESCAIKALSKWMASLQSANAGKSQANDSPEERQTISDQRLKKVLDL